MIQRHLLCLPSHTTQVLQPLDVGVFKSFKSNFSKACSKYLAANPGREITSDCCRGLASLSNTLNIMAGFKKTGIYTINPSEVNDRQLAPSKPFQKPSTENSQDGSASDNPPKDPLFSHDKVELCKKRYEVGYDLDDPSYTAWLKINHPTEVCSNTTKSSSSLVSGELSIGSRASADSGKTKLSGGDALSEILALPRPEPKTTSKRKPAMNAKAVCITDDTVLEDLKRKEKVEAKKQKEAKRIERERKKIREEKRLERECK